MSKLSIVIPVYFNQENLPKTIPRLLALQEKLKEHRLELIFVDDGSGDSSLEVLMQFHRDHPHVISVIKLTRNFGSMAAIQAGLSQASGDCVGVISADLQDPPELFIDMIEQWEKGFKAVYAVRQSRQTALSEKVFSQFFYTLFRRFAIPNYPKDGFDFLLIDRQIADKLNQIHENHTNIMTLIFWLGYPSVMIPYTRQLRLEGKSRWTFSKKLKLFIDSFISFSYAPIRFMSTIGILYALGAFTYASYLIYNKIFLGSPVEGWTALMVFISFTAGLALIMLGIVGEYIWRISDTIRKRPSYVIEQIESTDREEK